MMPAWRRQRDWKKSKTQENLIYEDISIEDFVICDIWGEIKTIIKIEKNVVMIQEKYEIRI
jgi:hypothetical protein